MKKIITISFILAFSFPIFAQLPVVHSGKIVQIQNFHSNYVTPRNIDVWLPENYSPQKKYAVLYMNDGQMLFDSSITWNKQEWGVDETVSALIAQKRINECIVVGIYNGGKNRHIEFTPQKPFNQLPLSFRQQLLDSAKRPNGNMIFSGEVMSDKYLAFVVQELKPYIDSAFSTKRNRANTMMMGSSMGGLISIYAICEYPEVFGAVGCLSTHWPVIFFDTDHYFSSAMNEYMQQHLPNPKTHKIYFDYGNKTLDSMYKPYQEKVDAIMMKAGYHKKNWITKEFLGDDHSEQSWRKRLTIPLLFLMQRNSLDVE